MTDKVVGRLLLPMSLGYTELDELSAIVGAPVAAADPYGWGFENRTASVTLADGRRLVVQRVTNRALARRTIRLARALPERLAALGLRAPRLLAADAEACLATPDRVSWAQRQARPSSHARWARYSPPRRGADRGRGAAQRLGAPRGPGGPGPAAA